VSNGNTLHYAGGSKNSVQLNALLHDRFEIETIKQEQGFFKQKL